MDPLNPLLPRSHALLMRATSSLRKCRRNGTIQSPQIGVPTLITIRKKTPSEGGAAVPCERAGPLLRSSRICHCSRETDLKY